MEELLLCVHFREFFACFCVGMPSMWVEAQERHQGIEGEGSKDYRMSMSFRHHMYSFCFYHLLRVRLNLIQYFLSTYLMYLIKFYYMQGMVLGNKGSKAKIKRK